MITITSKNPGFRRCGVAHPATPTNHADTAFSKAELALLQAEPMLTVTMAADKPSRANAGDTIKAVEEARDVAELDQYKEGEDRKSVLAAIAKRQAELSA